MCGIADNEVILSVAERKRTTLANERASDIREQKRRTMHKSANKKWTIESGMILNGKKIPNQQILCQEQFTEMRGLAYSSL